MMEVGFQLYNDMLAEAVRSLKAGREPDLLAPLSATTEINLHAPALLPDAYCGDVHIRLSLYKRLASAEPGRADRRPARGDHRPLRQAAAAGPDAVRRAPPARAGQGLRRGQDRRRRRSVTAITFMPNPPIDAIAHHRAGAEEPPHQAGRQRASCASSARRPRSEGPGAAGARRAALARHAEAAGGGMSRMARPRQARRFAPGLVDPRLHAAAAPRRLRPDRLRHGLDPDHDRVRRRDRRCRRHARPRSRRSPKRRCAARSPTTRRACAAASRCSKGVTASGAAARLRRAAAPQPGRRARWSPPARRPA